jgi:hypothetical protein
MAPITAQEVAAITRGGVTVQEAAYLSQAYYAPGSLSAIVDVEITLPATMIYAAIVTHVGKRVLIIRGTSRRGQWRRYNLALNPITAEGDTRRWHGGFLSVAEVVYAWVRDKAPLDLITGHSLAAGVGQIIGPSLGVPTIGFAAPNALYRDDPPARSDLVLNVCANDDLICALPFSLLGYRKAGLLLAFDPAGRHRGLDHGMALYRRRVEGHEAGTWEWVVPPSTGLGETLAEKVGAA